jgi:hypothetical protein
MRIYLMVWSWLVLVNSAIFSVALLRGGFPLAPTSDAVQVVSVVLSSIIAAGGAVLSLRGDKA